MVISIIGTGYVGLVTGAVLAELGNEVVCIDKDETKVNMLQSGRMPIFEPGLEEIAIRNMKDQRLRFTSNAEAAIAHSDIAFICVGTPPLPSGEPDISAVREAARAIAASLRRPTIVVNKSTVPVGTGEMVRAIIQNNRRHPMDFDVVSNPEFLREGSAIQDALRPDRIVIGTSGNGATVKMVELYAPLERPMLITDVVSAEIIKYASNAFLATKISYINSIANLCEAAGADVVQVMKGVGSDERIGTSFLQAGLGYGGSCFPKDTLALIHTSDKLGYSFDILKAVVKVNEQQTQRFIARLEGILEGFDGRRIGLLGLAFKPNTDDLREAKSMEIIVRLLANGARVQAYDPIAMDKARAIFPQITYAESAYEAAEDTDAMVVITEWNEFKQLNLERLRNVMRGNVLFDGRNIYDPGRMRKLGFEYYGIGRGVASQRTSAEVSLFPNPDFRVNQAVSVTQAA